MKQCLCDICGETAKNSIKINTREVDLCNRCGTLILRVIDSPFVMNKFYDGGDPYDVGIPEIRLKSLIKNRLMTTKEYAKTIIQDLLDNSDECARQRAIDFLKEK
jgi:hypothetical protein